MSTFQDQVISLTPKTGQIVLGATDFVNIGNGTAAASTVNLNFESNVTNLTLAEGSLYGANLKALFSQQQIPLPETSVKNASQTQGMGLRITGAKVYTLDTGTLSFTLISVGLSSGNFPILFFGDGAVASGAPLVVTAPANTPWLDIADTQIGIYINQASFTGLRLVAVVLEVEYNY